LAFAPETERPPVMHFQTAFIFASGITLGILANRPSSAPHAALTTIAEPATGDVEAMLADFAEDFRTDPTARAITFGVEVRDAVPARWHVYVGDRDGDTECPVEIAPGFPTEPVPYFTTDLKTLGAIHSGELGSMTAMAKAFSTDFAPLDVDATPEFRSDKATDAQLTSLSFHFWTRGLPERVQFDDIARTRPTHGSNAVLFYYQEGFRSGYFHIKPGDHANEDERSQTNPFSTLIVMTRGTVTARIGGAECTVKAGEAIVIGPDISHEFWLDEAAEGNAEGVLLMFGDGA
jgi:hypothetical protein